MVVEEVEKEMKLEKQPRTTIQKLSSFPHLSLSLSLTET